MFSPGKNPLADKRLPLSVVVQASACPSGGLRTPARHATMYSSGRKISATEKFMPTPDSLFQTALSKLLIEIFDGPPGNEAYLLNPGDIGLLRQLDSISAADA